MDAIVDAKTRFEVPVVVDFDPVSALVPLPTGLEERPPVPAAIPRAAFEAPREPAAVVDVVR